MLMQWFYYQLITIFEPIKRSKYVQISLFIHPFGFVYERQQN
jgi:hypothetical protein